MQPLCINSCSEALASRMHSVRDGPQELPPEGAHRCGVSVYFDEQLKPEQIGDRDFDFISRDQQLLRQDMFGFSRNGLS